jgi:hypothetical protein
LAQNEKQSAAKGGIAAEETIEITPLRRSYVVEPEMVAAWLRHFEGGCTPAHSGPDHPSFNALYANLFDDGGGERLSLAPGSRKNWWGRIRHHSSRLERAGLRQNGQARPRRAANANRTQASYDLTPSRPRHPDLGQGKDCMIASGGGGNSECGRDHDAQGQGLSNGDGDLTDDQRQRATGRSDEQRTDDAGTALQRRHSNTQRDEERQGIHCEREDRPAEQTDAECVEDKPKGKHGGGSMFIDLPVAPSTSTTAQLQT